MKFILNLVLFLVAAFLVYLLVQSIREPIAFKAQKEKREQKVVDKLMEIRTAQELYRNITGEFAHSFDTLAKVLREEDYSIVSIVGDIDDPNFTGEVVYDTLRFPAIDTIRALGISLDSLHFVPYGNGADFKIDADTMTYQKTRVNVVEVATKYNVFMGPWAEKRFQRYDAGYEPNKTLKFGDMNKPTTAGNWE